MSDDAGMQMLADLGIALQDPSLTEISSVGGTEISDEQLLDPVAEPDSPPIFTLQRMVFASMMKQVMQVVPLRDFYPQLKNVLIEVTDGRLSLTGSDSTSSVVSSTTAVRVDNPGRVLVGANRFAAVIARAAGAEVTIRCEGASVLISSGAASWSLRVASVQDYPPLPDLGDISWYDVDRSAFARAIGGTRYAASKDDNKDHIMQLDIAGGVVTATDDQRFAQVRESLPVEFGCQLPASGADLLIKMLENNDAAQFRMADTDFHIVAEIGPVHAPDRVIIAHLMRPFPPEARTALAAPQADNRDVLTVAADDLIEVLRRAAPTADEETAAVALRIGSPEPGKVTVASRNRYGDLSTEVIEAAFVVAGSERVAEARTVVVSHVHLLQAVRASVEASPLGDEEAGAGMVQLLLGQPRSRSRPAYVMVTDAGRTVQAVLSQVRSDWIS
jgi:DNA polymerase-3 subunit beta